MPFRDSPIDAEMHSAAKRYCIKSTVLLIIIGMPRQLVNGYSRVSKRAECGAAYHVSGLRVVRTACRWRKKQSTVSQVVAGVIVTQPSDIADRQMRGYSMLFLNVERAQAT